MATRLSKRSFTPIKKAVSFILFLMISLGSSAQFSVDAGKDTTYCSEQNFNSQILGAASKITNGKPPYKFAWECVYRITDRLIFTASFMLTDTTLQTPAFKNIPVDQDWLKFTLTVTDSENNIARDSLFVRFSSFAYLTGGGQPRFYIEKGDSILLTFPNAGIGGGIEPLTYYWRPKTFLSDPDSLVTWCKPDSSIQYEAFAIDSCGCVSAILPVYDIRVLPDTNDNKPEFAPIGAEWYYNYDPDITLDDGYQKISVLKDTIIDNHNCRLLQIRNIGYSYFYQKNYNYKAGNIILYESGDTVHYYKNGQFYILYDFSAKSGDTFYSISYLPNCTQAFKVRVDSITNIEINDQLLKKFHITLNDSLQANYIEKIGYNDYLLPQFGLGCEILTGPHYPGPLRCYYDNEIGVYSTNIVSACDYITISDEIEMPDDWIRVFPNPAASFVTISNPANIPIKRIELTDFSGRVVQTWKAQEMVENTLNIQHIPPGIYLLKAVTETGIKTGKLVVQ